MLVLVLLQGKLAGGKLLALSTILTLLQNFVLVGFGLVFEVVRGELYSLCLTWNIGCRQIVWFCEVEFGQSLGLGKEFPSIELVFNLLVVADT